MKQTILLTTSLLILLVSVTVYGGDSFETINTAEEAYERGQYLECAKNYEVAIKQGTDDKDIYYNYAVCLAKIGENDKAFDNLEKALEKGFINIDGLRKDTDLYSLHKDKRWLVVVSKGEKYRQKYFETINVWVYQMYEADQIDRKNYKKDDNWSAITQKDSMRRERIKNIVDKRQLKASDDYYHAAMIMHHGTNTDDYELAHELAAKAVELDSSNLDARWLYAASQDRYLLKTGKPQIYGTQYNYKNGAWTLEPFDKNAITDKQRKQWGVPSIDEAQRKVDRLNSQ